MYIYKFMIISTNHTCLAEWVAASSHLRATSKAKCCRGVGIMRGNMHEHTYREHFTTEYSNQHFMEKSARLKKLLDFRGLPK